MGVGVCLEPDGLAVGAAFGAHGLAKLGQHMLSKNEDDSDEGREDEQ